MGEGAGDVLWGRVRGKQAFGQGAPRDQQGEGPGPGSPGLGLRQGQLEAESPNGVSVGMICPRVKIGSPRAIPAGQPKRPPKTLSTDQGPHHLTRVPRSLVPWGAGFGPLFLCRWVGRPHPGAAHGEASWPRGRVASSGDKGSRLGGDVYVAVHLWEAWGRGLGVESSPLAGPGLELSSRAHGWELQAG